ncbi:flagellar biosynthesis anti-sigma factor FlgM [Rhodoferax sp. PAMC 29310]|uniref:flagellar biosynthesis anti-sigma factor FlgM n=1 Tax=Rhodoferax sp. PAMC 29310 TaxID=2822760 RepID=UPI001B345096|nr:flagellar biosynthesis anti-sigma factor FlgM [Rhodoferax sp. PAMC 29310]
MKIGQPSDTSVPVNSTAANAPAKGGQSSTAASAASAQAPSAGVAVTVSPMARTLEASKRSEAADVDMKKVNSVRSAIEQGTYKVNPEAIADKLISSAQEILKRTSN